MQRRAEPKQNPEAFGRLDIRCGGEGREGRGPSQQLHRWKAVAHSAPDIRGRSRRLKLSYGSQALSARPCESLAALGRLSALALPAPWEEGLVWEIQGYRASGLLFQGFWRVQLRTA